MSSVIYDTSVLVGYILADFVSFIDGLYSGIIAIFIVLLIPMLVYTIYKIMEDSLSYEGH